MNELSLSFGASHFKGCFQGPEKEPSSVFTWSHIFVRFTKIRSFTNTVFLKESYTKVVSFGS